MIALKAKEWDVISGALLQAKDNEWEWIEKGCECNQECDPTDYESGCYDETQIRILEALFHKVHLIKQAMEYFEMEILK